MSNKPLATIALIVSVTGCGQSAPPAPAGPNPASGGPSGEIVAEVGGRAITAAQVAAFARLRGHLQLTPEVRDWALAELTDLNLLAAEAEAGGLADANLEAEVQVQRLSLLANRAMSAQARLNPVGEADLNAEYERQVGVTGRHEYRLHHILLADRAAADTVIAGLAGGETFKSLVESYAGQIGVANAGDLGWVNLAQVPAAFAEPIKALEPGAYTKTPIQTEYGWHVVYLEQKRAFEPPAFETVKEGIRSTLSRQQVERYLASLRARAGIPPR